MLNRIVTFLALSLAVSPVAHAQMRLTSGDTQLEFAAQENGLALTALRDRRTQLNFIEAQAERRGLWRIEFRPKDGKEADAVVLDEATVSVKPAVEQGKDQLRFLWKNLSVGTQQNAADVTVTISAIKGTSMTDWRIAVQNRATQIGLWQVDFPRVSRLFTTPTGQAATPFGMGMVIDDPVHNESMNFGQRYPEALYSMQFASLSDKGSCLYLGTHDPHAYVKEMTFKRESSQKGLNYQIRQFPPDMGVPLRNYVQPYPCLLGIIEGDWVNAAKVYRKWVLANSDWMKGKQPLQNRQDMPDWVKKMPLWAGFHGMTDDAMQKSEAFIKYMDVPVAVHMYHWHNFDFDTKYPDFWPPQPPTDGYVKRLQALGAKVMPYTNTHLMDEMAPSWVPDGASRFVALGADGKPDGQIVDAHRRLDAMCPATAYWQTKFNGLTTHLVKDLGVDGIYLDQVAAMPPTLCFDPTHGHSLGGGNYWVTGHARQIQNIRQMAKQQKQNVFLTTESAAEPYDFDAYLRVNEGAPFLTPIWQQVYSGYRLSFGFAFYEQPEWIVKLATQYLWGVQIGWANQFDPKDMPEIAAFEREVARARYAGSGYMALGEMLRDPVISGDLARVKTTWQNFAMKIPIDWPAIKGSLWRAPNGSVGVAMVNLHTASQTATVTIPRKETGFGKGPIRVRVLYPHDMMPAQIIDGDSLSAKVTMPASSAAIVVLEPVNASTSRVTISKAK